MATDPPVCSIAPFRHFQFRGSAGASQASRYRLDQKKWPATIGKRPLSSARKAATTLKAEPPIFHQMGHQGNDASAADPLQQQVQMAVPVKDLERFCRFAKVKLVNEAV